MRRPTPLPEALRGRPFHRDEALQLGVTARMLQHPRFEEVLHRVYREVGTALTPDQHLAAAALALPSDARLSHHTRFVPLGLEYGALLPMHFTVGRDHHIALDDVFLHRTEVLPSHDDAGLSIEAAYLGAASILRLVDTIKIGDWLLHRGHLDLGRLRALMSQDPWRPGIVGVETALPHLEPRSRSLLESEGRVFLTFAGLPRPQSNLDVYEQHEFLCCGDLALPELRLVIEIEGRQHAFDTAQFVRDIDRYARVRGAGWEYVQATALHLARPRSYVQNVYRVMRSRGYRGPAPSFGPRWERLFAPAIRHRPPRGR